MPTGSIEVVLKEFKVINSAKKQLPFVIRDFHKVTDLTDKYKLESSAVYCEQSLRISMLKLNFVKTCNVVH
jgi:aspartyl-tRNA synthetase